MTLLQVLNRKAETLITEIDRVVDPGNTMMKDQWTGYSSLSKKITYTSASTIRKIVQTRILVLTFEVWNVSGYKGWLECLRLPVRTKD